SFAVVTGHEDVAKDESAIRWDKLATAVDTIVFLMGRKTLPLIVEQLTAHGRPADTPVAVVQWATTPRQRTVVGTLADIVQRAEEAGLGAPAVTVVGEVVRLRDVLAWYEQRPLFGKRVLVTRTRRQASALADLLAQEGAEAVELPVIQIVETVDAERLAEAVARLALSSPKGGYDWLVFTSANGVEVFFSHLRRLGRDARALAGARVAAIGPATADALAERGIVADIVPPEFIAEGVVEALREEGLEGKRVLLARAEGARPELVEGLRSLGAQVDELPLYRSELPPADPDASGLAQLRAGEIDVVTFTSSSTVRHLAQMLGGDVECLRKAVVACIGPVTAKTAEELGLRVDVVAEEHTVPGLVAALRDHFSRAADTEP
ncbi:MAG: uroporphyrinogen-III synthase, partial [Chloroflexota bacterium]|nr:uroporphyrinogen-III synthase [Chloroflexota bacterium]